MLRVGVIGAGYFSAFQLDAWQRLPGITIAGVCDTDAGRARELAQRYGAEAAFDDARRMIETAEPNLLDIVTPPETHAALIELAASNGLPVVCQKPLAPTLADAEAMVERAETAGIELVVHENFRWQPWYRKMRDWIDKGRLGRPYRIAFRLRPGDGRGGDAYADRQPYFREMERFLIHETGIHFIDTFRFLFGEVIAVTAQLQRLNPAIAGEDAALVVFEFENGASGLFDGNRLNDHPAEDQRLTMGDMWVEGSEGTLRLDGDGGLWWKAHGKAETALPFAWDDQGFAGDCVAALQAHVLKHFLTGSPLENRGRDYLANMRVEDAIYRSNEEQRRIAV